MVNKASFFAAENGLRQGKNLSHLLFSLFLNDLELFIVQRGSDGIDIEYVDDEVYYFLKILVLLYADDTIIFAEDEATLQQNLDHF